MSINKNPAKIMAKRFRVAAKLLECEGFCFDLDYLKTVYPLVLKIIQIPLIQMFRVTGLPTEFATIARSEGKEPSLETKAPPECSREESE